MTNLLATGAMFDMGELWNIIHTGIAVGTAVGVSIMVWWRVKKESAENARVIMEHDAAILRLEAEKATNIVVEKLGSVVERLEHDLIDHHKDFKVHRTPDSEQRMTDLVNTVNHLIDENREAHEKIMERMSLIKF